jgi:hypothetical protein
VCWHARVTPKNIDIVRYDLMDAQLRSPLFSMNIFGKKEAMNGTRGQGSSPVE